MYKKASKFKNNTFLTRTIFDLHINTTNNEEEALVKWSYTIFSSKYSNLWIKDSSWEMRKLLRLFSQKF